MNNSKALLGARIKEVRKKRKLSQVGLAGMVGIEAKHLSRIEVGRNFPSLGTLHSISDVLGVEVKDLFDFADHAGREELRERICSMLDLASDRQLRLIAKLVRDVVS